MMKFPPAEVCPRIPLTEEIKREAEFYVYNSAIRGLLDDEKINLAAFDMLLCRKPEKLAEYINGVNRSPLSQDFRKLQSYKRVGISGEITFNIHRGVDYHIAFEVAESYIYHEDKSYIFPEFKYTRTLPDACLNSAVSVVNNCFSSKTIDVKTQFRKENNNYVGLSIKVGFPFEDDLYVAVSERESKTYPYDVIDYAILGYAFKEEIKSATPMYGRKIDFERGYHFIHFLDLHPISFLTPASYETSLTVRDLIEAGCDV